MNWKTDEFAHSYSWEIIARDPVQEDKVCTREADSGSRKEALVLRN